MSGCVIPVSPQFDDPEPNFPPFIVTSEPGVGEIFTPQGTDRSVTVTIGDQNLGDTLFIRWLIDYPNADPTNSRRAIESRYEPSPTTTRSPPLRFTPFCNTIPKTGNPHRLVMSVSDRPFLEEGSDQKVSTDAPFDTVPDGANRLRAVWLLNMDCGGNNQ
jgi:hypothetical protein